MVLMHGQGLSHHAWDPNTLAGCGHIPMFDHPDAVAALLIQASTTDPVNLQSALT
jgi:hypothetical protein